jgi:hypothetical protein
MTKLLEYALQDPTTYYLIAISVFGLWALTILVSRALEWVICCVFMPSSTWVLNNKFVKRLRKLLTFRPKQL